MVADHVAELMELLGSDVLLIACRPGTKRPVGRWQSIGPEKMNDPQYLAKLNKVNIGVVLGPRSSDLCTLDIDSDDNLTEFMKENEEICNTLITRGKRGANLWFRMQGDYPGLTPLKVRGEHWGEWRGDGSQTVIHGEHPSGGRYHFLRRVSPIRIAIAQIRWPENLEPKRLLARYKNVQVQECTECTESTESPESSECSESSECAESIECTDAYKGDRCVPVASPISLTFEEALRRATPKTEHQNHDKLFLLARWVKSVEAKEQRQFSLEELLEVFKGWAAVARTFWRQGLSEDDYRFEFLEAYQCARFGLGVNPIDAAWERAREKELPAVALQFSEDGVRKLVLLCRELGEMSKGQPFYLSARDAMRVLRLSDPARAARWLKGLRHSHVLTVTEEGGPKTMKATRYLYIAKD